MHYNIQSIETLYNGIHFRSRLEARWAIFFETLNLEYRYEPRSYTVAKNLIYLPDFYIPYLMSFVEIKGPTPNRAELAKANGLTRITHTPVFVFFGDLEIPHPQTTQSAYVFFEDENRIFMDRQYWWVECPSCHTLGLTHQGYVEALCTCHIGDWKLRNFNSHRLVKAYNTARGAKWNCK